MTQEILALEVPDEKIHDSSKMLKKLINCVLYNFSKPITAKIKAVMADDGAYDLKNNFRYLQEKRIRLGIKVRSHSVVSIRNNRLRNKKSMLQTKDLLKWKKKRTYGQKEGWMSETVFSAIKRMFGEHTSAIKFQNMVKEMMIKVSLDLLRN